jgi:translation initiation factor 2B subunit (eIF-2B alpha/beta/delta family)
VLITPDLSAIASLVKSPVQAVPPSTPSQDVSSKGPIGGEGEVDELLQQVYNPSFDVTPADLIAAIVTEKGVAVKEEGSKEYQLKGSSVV